MKIKIDYKFYITLAIFTILIFIFNSENITQWGVFNYILKPISESIISGNGYTCYFFNYQPTFYPLWGYTLLVTLDTFFNANYYIILIIQAILSIIGIYYFYKLFSIKPKLFHIPLFLPYIAMFSVKWPDGIVIMLFILIFYHINNYLKLNQIKYLIYSGIILGIAANLRSEYLYFPILLLILLFFNKYKKTNILKLSTILIITAFVFMLPWAIRSYSLTGKFRTDATNGGTVAYISLGQLPNNPWDIVPADKTAFDYATKIGEHNPYTTKADSVFKQEFFKALKSQPLAFAKKCFLNIFHSIVNGVYTGEYANWFISDKDRFNIDKEISEKSGIFNKVSYIISLDLNQSLPLVLEKFIRAVFIPIFLLLQIIFIITLFKKNENYKTIILIIAIFTIYKLLTIGALQYEYRHINILYIFFLGPLLIYLPTIKEKLPFFKKK